MKTWYGHRKTHPEKGHSAMICSPRWYSPSTLHVHGTHKPRGKLRSSWSRKRFGRSRWNRTGCGPRRRFCHSAGCVGGSSRPSTLQHSLPGCVTFRGVTVASSFTCPSADGHLGCLHFGAIIILLLRTFNYKSACAH